MRAVLDPGTAAIDVDLSHRRRRPRRLSLLFSQMAETAEGRVSVAQIVDGLGDRSFAALLVFFGALNMIPMPPGVSAILGLPLLIVAAQLLAGGRRVWLPAFVGGKTLGADQFRAIVDRIVPRLLWLERVVRPRYWPFWRRRGDRVVGALALFFAIIVTLPIPLGNWLPACAITLLGLSLSERDGLLFGAGCAVGVLALVVIAAVAGAAGLALQAVYGWMF